MRVRASARADAAVAEPVWRRIVQEVRHWTRPHWTLADVGAHWDRTGDYDEINRNTYAYFRRFTDGLRLSDLPPRARVLDICARTGYGTLYFYQHGRIDAVVCADVSVRMGEVCRRRLAEHGVRNFSWVHLLDDALPFRDGEFDAVLCFETVEHFPRPQRLVCELGRVTRAGGTLVLTTPNALWEPVHALAAIAGLHHSEGPHRFLRYRRLLAMLAQAGFQLVRAETTVLVPAGPEILVRLGTWVEERTRRWLMPWIGLRRVLVCSRR